jgi:hypothetical protein
MVAVGTNVYHRDMERRLRKVDALIEQGGDAEHLSKLQEQKAALLAAYKFVTKDTPGVDVRVGCAYCHRGKDMICRREENPAKKLCGRCETYMYCNKECFKAHWKAEHKHNCPGPKASNTSSLLLIVSTEMVDTLITAIGGVLSKDLHYIDNSTTLSNQLILPEDLQLPQP